MDNIKIENNKCILDISDPDDYNRLALLGRAIYAPARIEIINLLYEKPLLLSDIAAKLDMPISSVAFHLKVLQEAHLIGVDYTSKSNSTLKYYTYTFPEITILMKDTRKQNSDLPEPYSTEINIGDFIDAEFNKRCGIASETEMLVECEQKKMFSPVRKNAQLIWTNGAGFVTYALPNDFVDKGKVAEINFSLELCSEATGYNQSYPSDITFWINDKELCTYTCPGDFGDRYGKYTPSWWYAESTKYGLMTTVSVRTGGVFLNEKCVNKKVNIDALSLSSGNRITLKIGVKNTAANIGGFNIFGNRFGDYAQHIVFNAVYSRIKRSSGK